MYICVSLDRCVCIVRCHAVFRCIPFLRTCIYTARLFPEVFIYISMYSLSLSRARTRACPPACSRAHIHTRITHHSSTNSRAFLMQQSIDFRVLRALIHRVIESSFANGTNGHAACPLKYTQWHNRMNRQQLRVSTRTQKQISRLSPA